MTQPKFGYVYKTHNPYYDTCANEFLSSIMI